jgi:hypothetical protein
MYSQKRNARNGAVSVSDPNCISVRIWGAYASGFVSVFICARVHCVRCFLDHAVVARNLQRFSGVGSTPFPALRTASDTLA